MATKTLPKEVSQEEVFKDFFKSYPATTKSNPSSYFIKKEDGTYEMHLTEICHASMTSPHMTGSAVEMVTACPMASEVDLMYLRMLVNGPYRAFSDNIEIKKSGDFYYLHITNLDKFPANVLYNFNIATRLPIEFPDYLKRFPKLLAKGYNPTLAFLLSWMDYQHSASRYWHSEHLWFDTSSNWKSILEGNPSGFSAPFGLSRSGCRPANKIWGYAPDEAKKIDKMSEEAIVEYFGMSIKPKPEPVTQKPIARKIPKNLNYEQLVEHLGQFNPGPNQFIPGGVAVNAGGVMDIEVAQHAPVPAGWVVNQNADGWVANVVPNFAQEIPPQENEDDDEFDIDEDDFPEDDFDDDF